MTDELRALCALTGEVLFGYRTCEHKEKLDWDEMYALSHKQSVVSSVIYAAPDSISKNLQRTWIADAYQIEKNNRLVYNGNFYIHELLQKNHIPYVILKGLASTAYYGEGYYRIQGDVDFLVPEERTEETKKLLRENGFREGFVLDYETEYDRNGVSFELHTDVNGIPEGEKGQKIRNYLKDIIDTAVPLQTDGGEVMIPDEFHHGLVILLHTAKHLVSFGIGLRQISDWAVFVNRTGERFPELFEKALTECGLWTFAKAFTAACVKYLQMKPLSWTGTCTDEFLERVMDDLVRKGGIHHDENDDMDTLLIEKTDRGGVSDSPMLIRLVQNIGRKAQFRWPYMKKVKVMIPFGIAVMCTQYAVGMLTGKYKKINPGEMTAKAKNRRQLYKELNLFE